MNSFPSGNFRALFVAAGLLIAAVVASAQVPLADQPVFSAVNVPGNLALALSVEYPTAISVAHPSRTYSSANNYIGYFDPAKCYAYRYTDGVGIDNYFYPVGRTTTRTCSGNWSGNYLNWASMQTIDPFRWALTGGYRVVDTPSLTVLEKAWATSQGNTTNFPDSSVSSSADVAGATPFAAAASISTRIWSLGNKMRFMTAAAGLPTTNFAGAAAAYDPGAVYQHGTLYEVFIRVKVCDASASVDNLEGNCAQYGGNAYKPTGLLQQYADKIRYSAFGYLNDSNISTANMNRDGGVLRARQKFIGPQSPVPGGLPIANASAEWDASTGVMLANPDPADARSTSGEFGVAVANSGVMNYLNKFGEITPGGYKYFDPVSELYYGVQRYFRNKGNVPAWSSMASADAATRKTWADGFPVITAWKDPIQYSCQRNFILGIGDVNTHADRNVPGATGASESAQPPEVSGDTEINATEWTNKVGLLQGLGGSLGSVQNYNGCCSNNGALIAGLAYWSNMIDIRPDLPGNQSIKTYWLDVLEYQRYRSNNQFYLAAKFGGFNPPSTFSVSSATKAQLDANKAWWSTTGDKLPDGAPRPDNYFTAAQADQMVAGLRKTFSSIASQLNAYTTSFATASPQVSALGVAAYSTKYDAKTWTGELIASNTVFDAETGAPDMVTQWKFSEVLAAQAAGTGWKNGRNIVTFDAAKGRGVPFREDTISASQRRALNTSYGGGNDAIDYLNYVRGERTNERSSVAPGSTHAYRDRAGLVGDIVNAKARPVGPPSAPYSSASNPGYDVFKANYANRRKMVYVGTNAGMLHAVDGTLSGPTAGKEVWAFVPGGVFEGPTSNPSVSGLASFGNPDFVHHFLLDASPQVIDVDLGRTQGGSGTDWRTLLIGGLGKGGKTIYALDVTDPSSVTSEATAAQKVLWEFSDPQLGFTYGQPAVVKTRKYGWVVVAGSGYNNSGGQGYFFFINPRNGALLEKVAAPCSECSTTKQAGLAQVNAFVIDLTDGVADAIYGGDLMGNVWRVDVTGTGSYPNAVKFATLVGSDGKPLPITSRPLPVVQPGSNRRYIAVGTGRLLDSSDLNSSQAQRFFAIIDGTNAQFSNDGSVNGTKSDLPPGITFPLTVAHMRQLTDLSAKISLDLRSQLGWFVDLGVSAGGAGWRVLSDPTSFYGTVAFAATSPSTADACSPNGSSRVYALDLGTGNCAVTRGGPSCYAPINGVINDLQYYSVNVKGVGKSQLMAGNDGSGCSGNECKPVERIETRPPATLGLKRMNWREIQVNK
ncbi:type IV pilus assembly protein PilY1 [Pelomonas saccharophila]|uniref:Type IV pilus assembly protein PilY1 n=1 Tax=Roseateles saccharophilus TaxID=304 RepID=A0ABU1YR32_ROSSA|nr:PilC/PilY family type IV pilus protein [Roseateles saccharophilus]MDR7271317.1 type IV pilus assembly protein PilY1 [Roseateles saccharophilus]